MISIIFAYLFDNTLIKIFNASVKSVSQNNTSVKIKHVYKYYNFRRWKDDCKLYKYIRIHGGVAVAILSNSFYYTAIA